MLVTDSQSLKATLARPVVAAPVGVVLVALAIAPLALHGLVRTLIGAVGLGFLVVAGHRLAQVKLDRQISLPLVLSSVWLGGLTAAAMLVGILPLAEGRDPSKALTATSMLSPDLFSAHPLGTDGQALDVLAQLLYGARVSIVVAVGAVLFAFTIGGSLGVIAGYFRGKVEAVIGFITDVMMSFPALILLMALASVFKPSVPVITIALGVLGTPSTIRLARASTLAVASRDFVVASRTLGAKTRRIVFGEVIPNVVPPLIAYSFIAVGFLIVAEASLSFLGLGIQRPNPTWGNLISQGQAALATQPWLVILPSIFLFLTVLASNYIGQRLSQKWAI